MRCVPDMLLWSTAVLLLPLTSSHKSFLEIYPNISTEDAVKDDVDSYLRGNVNNIVGQMDSPVEEGGGTRGRGRTEKDTQEMEAICSCFRSDVSFCSADIEAYGPIVVDGRCIGGIMRRRRREMGRGDLGDDPVMLIEELGCQGSKPLIFASSGTETQLMVGSVPSVLICRDSISPHLQQLTVSGVQEIKVAAGALMPRDTNIVLNFSRIEHKFILPEGAFTVEGIQPEKSRGFLYDLENDEHLPPAEVQLLIDSVKEVEFKHRSIVAPRISISMREVSQLTIGPQAIIPYFQPEASSFNISHSQFVMMEMQAINTGYMNIIHTQQLILKESSVDVVNDGMVHLEDIGSVVLQDNALALSSGVSLKLQSLNITSAGHRSIHNYNTTINPLLNVNIINVSGSKVQPGAFCLATESLVFHNLDLDWSEERAAACIQADIIFHKDERELAGIVVCQSQPDTNLLCNSPHCIPCLPQAATAELTEAMMEMTSKPVSTTQMTTLRSYTAFPTTSLASELLPTTEPTPKEDIILVEMTLTPGSFNETDSTDESVLLWDIGGLPLYAVLLAILAGIISSLLIAYYVCKYLRRKKHAKYKLPRAVPNRTFQKAIVTAENLSTLNKAAQPNCTATPAEMYVTYSVSQPLNEVHTPTTDDYTPSTNFHTLPANAYLPPVDTRMAPDDDHIPSAEACVPPADAHTPLAYTTVQSANNTLMSSNQIPGNDVQKPPADNYFQSANDHIPLADSNDQHT